MANKTGSSGELILNVNLSTGNLNKQLKDMEKSIKQTCSTIYSIVSDVGNGLMNVFTNISEHILLMMSLNWQYFNSVYQIMVEMRDAVTLMSQEMTTAVESFQTAYSGALCNCDKENKSFFETFSILISIIVGIIAIFSLFIPIVFAAIAIGVIALIAAIISNWNKITDFFNNKESNLSDHLYDIFNTCGEDLIVGFLNGILYLLTNPYGWIIENVARPLVNGIKDFFGIHSPSTVMMEIGNMIMLGLFEGVKSMVETVIEVFKGLWEGIKNIFSNVSNWFRDQFTAAWEAVRAVFSAGGQIFQGIQEGILSGLKTVVNAIINGINRIIKVPFDGLNGALRRIRGVSILGLSPFSWIGEIKVPQIPALASGAVVPPNREFLAILGDNKRETEVVSPLSTMKEAMAQVLTENGNGELTVLLKQILMAIREKDLTIDGKTLSGVVTKYQNNAMRQTGGTILSV